MSSPLPPDVAATRKKLLSKIATAQKQADAAKRLAKLAKTSFKAAKQRFKDAKRSAKKLRKEVKALKGELASLAPAKSVGKAAAKSAPKRTRPAVKRPVDETASVAEAPVAPVEAVAQTAAPGPAM